MKDVTTEKKRFWIPRSFVDDQAVKFSPYTQAVYMSLCRHADKAGFSFWGCRRIAEQLGMNKSTVSASIRELVVSGLAVRGYNKEKKVCGLTLADVRYEAPRVYGSTVPKEVSKQVYKEETLQARRTGSEGMTKLKETLMESNGWLPRPLREPTKNVQTPEDTKPL